jgi:hypothetical protein
MARVDYVAAELTKDPLTQVYIMSYSGKGALPGRVIEYEEFVKPFLMSVRGIDAGRIINVRGGARERFLIEVWLVPHGAHPPVPNPPLSEENEDNSVPLKYDEGFADYSGSGRKSQLWTRDMDCTTDGISLRNFGVALRSKPGFKGHVIVYNECGKSRRRADVVANLVLGELERKQHVRPGLVSTRYGGCRDVPSVELWVVPGMGEIPKATPGRVRSELE